VRLLAFSLLLLACEAADPPRWHVAGGFIRAPDGRAVILRGANLSDAQKRAPYLDPANEADYRALREVWGFNAIRFVMTWAAVEPDRGRYDDAYLDEVAERMKWAQAAGLHVILDMHQDVYGEGFGFDGAPRWTCDEARYQAFVRREPWFLNNLDENVVACVDGFWKSDDLRDRFVATWTHVAARLKDAPAVIGFDVLNEPGWGSYSIFDFEADLLYPLYRRVVTAVRAEAPGWLAFLEPSASRNAGIATGLPRPDFRDVVYAPHSYDSAAEGSGTFDPARREAILETGAKLAEEANALGAALWIGEYGGIPAGGGFAEYMAAEHEAQGAAAAGSMYWEAGRNAGYALHDPSGAVKPEALRAIALPHPEEVAGDPIRWQLTGTRFVFRFTGNGSVKTEIRIPPSAWPGGYQVECGGCTVQKHAGGVTLTAIPAGEITVEIF
jgi:endoglycosylceramidase